MIDMNPEPQFCYLLGMLIGKGHIIRKNNNTTEFIIELPHKSLRINGKDASLYVKASVLDIKGMLDPFIGKTIHVESEEHKTQLSFVSDDSQMITIELLKLLGNMPSYKDMRIPSDVFQYPNYLKKEFLKGLADVTAHIRSSNMAYGEHSENRVYIEIPDNWFLVVDIANLLKQIDIPVQDIDWAHPNFRDSNLSKYQQGNKYFWKKEHQIKIYADQFLPVGFVIEHKEKRLEELAKENKTYWAQKNHRDQMTLEQAHHRYYWETADSCKSRPPHPMENDKSLPDVIRGKHFDSWKTLAKDLGYGKGD